MGNSGRNLPEGWEKTGRKLVTGIAWDKAEVKVGKNFADDEECCKRTLGQGCLVQGRESFGNFWEKAAGRLGEE